MPGYHLPLFAADAMGIWHRHGLDVELVDPEPGPENAKAAAAGRYDSCLTSLAHFLHAKRDDPNLAARFVFMVARRTHLTAFCVDARPAAHGRPIESFDDLAGASFLGEPQAPFAREYVAVLRLLGLAPGRGVALPYAQQFEALAAGEGDVGIDFLNLGPRFEQAAAPGQRIRALPFHEAGIDLYGSGLVVGTRLIQMRPDLVGRLTAALDEALLATRAEPEAGLAALLARFPAADADGTLAGWRSGEPLVFAEEVGAMTPETSRRTLEFHTAVHGTPQLEPADVFESSFVDAREAVAAEGHT